MPKLSNITRFAERRWGEDNCFLALDRGDIMDIVGDYNMELAEEATGVFGVAADGEYKILWYTESRRPYLIDAEYTCLYNHQRKLKVKN